MAEAAVTVALETIRDLVIAEGKFLFNVRDQVEELAGELEALQSFLKDATARKHEHESVRTWVSQAKRLAYRAEDIIEEYAIKVASKRGGGFRKGARRAACIAVHKAGNKIGKIKTEIANLKNNLKDYGIKEIIQAQPLQETIEKQRRLRTTYAHQVDEYFVGMDDDVSKIVTWVTEDHMIRRVISICGSGGSGKTTIARKVFNRPQVERTFECFAWVSVTQQCQVKMVMQNILNQVLGYKVSDLEENELVRKLYDVLKNKKCFVVLDDIWKLDDWESLRPAFPTLERSSKILLTTRITEVAEVAQQDSRHKPKLLDDRDGWDLLTKIAPNLQEDQGETTAKQVELVARDMLHKCGGLPLAISLLGGILRNKGPGIEWDTVNNKIVDVLAFSYDDLPSYLRPCFLYMGCFREDEEINVTRLYQLWMAEGLISTSGKGPGEILMNVASDFLDELISRNMVQLVIRDELADQKYCRLHDLMRDLCLTKGREEEFMEVNTIQIRGEEVGSVCIDGLNLCRQTIMVNCDDHCEIRMIKSTSETYFRALIFSHSNSYITCVVEGTLKFKRLRSLIMDDCTFTNKKLPEEIRDMIHLRYLSLQKTLEESELPAFVGDLQYIQTLDVSNNIKLQLPNIFHKMKRLRCLYLPYFRVQSKSGKRLEFHGLNELEVVEGLDTEYDKFPDFSKLVNLQRLNRCTIQSYEELFTTSEQLNSLLQRIPRRNRNQISVDITFRTEESGFSGDVKKHQFLLCRSLHKLVLCAPIGKFPRYEDQFWPDLVTLELSWTEFEEDPMPFLQELPNLRTLKMLSGSYVGKEMYCSSKAFPKLTFLEISDLPDIEKWRVDVGAFPNLQTFLIWSCNSRMEIVPHGLTSITSLTRIDMDDMPEEFRNKYGTLPNSTRTAEE